MNTRIFKLVLILAITFNFSCKKEATVNYKYADQPDTVTCNSGYDDLLKEALYAFENAMTSKLDPNGQNKLRAYRSFISNALTNRPGYLETIITKHTKEVFDALKNKPGLFNGNTLNYDGEVTKCIGNNIKDPGLKTTFNALLKANSMSAKLFGAPLRSSTAYSRDTNLATYIALDLFYARMHDIDFTKVDLEANEPKPQPIDFNKKPTNTPPIQQQKKEIDHSGHNHD